MEHFTLVTSTGQILTFKFLHHVNYCRWGPSLRTFKGSAHLVLQKPCAAPTPLFGEELISFPSGGTHGFTKVKYAINEMTERIQSDQMTLSKRCWMILWLLIFGLFVLLPDVCGFVVLLPTANQMSLLGDNKGSELNGSVCVLVTQLNDQTRLCLCSSSMLYCQVKATVWAPHVFSTALSAWKLKKDYTDEGGGGIWEGGASYSVFCLQSHVEWPFFLHL